MSSSGRPLRLLFVGNPESIHLCRWVRFFVERGHEAHVAGLGSSRPDDDNAPFPIHRLGHPAAAVVGLRRLARRLSADLVHAHYLTHYGWLARLVGQTPFAVTLWGSDILLDLRGSPVRRAWARLVLRAAACVTADSPQIVDLAVGLGARPARIHEIQFGIDIKRFAPGPRPDELLEALGLVDRRIVFAPRAIRPLYRTDLLVRALRSLPDDVVLLGTLAGADPGFVGQVMSEAASNGLTERVRLVPTIPHEVIDMFYRAATVVASVPTSDATPVSVLEALATGVPVVATDLPSVRPWLEVATPDLIVPVDDVNAIVTALRAALALPPVVRERNAIIGRALVVDRADYRSNMLKMEALYRSIAAHG